MLFRKDPVFQFLNPVTVAISQRFQRSNNIFIRTVSGKSKFVQIQYICGYFPFLKILITEVCSKRLNFVGWQVLGKQSLRGGIALRNPVCRNTNL